MNNICKFAAYSMLGIALLSSPVFSQERAEVKANESIDMTEADMTYIMPELSIDAERATYQALISRPQDVISKNQMESTPTHNPVEMLRNYNSSVALGGDIGGATVTPSVRGLSSRYTSVTVDGMSVNTPWNWSSPLSGFPLSRLKKITVTNSGSAIVYGQNAVAGNVNFVLPSGEDYEGFTLGFETGGEGTKHLDVMYGINDENSQHLFGVFKDEYDGTRKFTNGKFYKNSRDNTMFYYKGSIDLSNDWTFKTTIMRNEGTITVGDAWGNFEKFDPWKMSLRSYALVKDFKNDSNFTLRYSRYNDYSRDVYYTDGTFTTVKNPGREDGFTNVDMKTWEALYNFKAGEKNYINLGVQNQKVADSHDSVSADYKNKEYDNTSFFIADSITANDKLNVHVAARSDESYEGERDTSYSLNTNYEFNGKFSFGLGYSHTIQLPTFQDMYIGKARKNNGDISVGNKDLESEKSNNYEARLGYKLNDKWSFNLTGYKYDIEDMIVYKKAGDLGLTGTRWFRDNKGGDIVLRAGDSVKTNINEAELTGFEFATSGKINDKFNLNLSYTKFQKAEDKSNNVRVTDIPKYRATMALEYNCGKDTAVIYLSHQGEIPETQGYEKVDSHSVCDLYYKRQCNKDFSVYVKVANVGNDTSVILCQNAPSRSAGDSYYYEDGRVITVGCELKCN